MPCLAALMFVGCAETQQEKETNNVINEVQNPDSGLRRQLHKAAEHLPPGSSIEEQTRQAERENTGR